MSRFLQLVLDLFDGHAPSAASVHAAPATPSITPNTPSHSADGAHPATAASPLPLVPGESLAQVLPPAHYVHPRATRRIQLGHTDVAYAFRRSKRRTIGMAVGPDGLEVSAPRWVTVGEVESALREKADWIARKLVEMGQRQQQLGAARIDWRHGVVLPYMGEQLQVLLDSSATLKKSSVQFEEAAPLHTLRLGLPQHATPAQIRDAVQAWLMRQAKALFTERLNHYAPRLGVQWQRLSLSSATTRWGSASANGSIRLNWRLLHHKLAVIDYVVAHELSHLRVMDHSPRFWHTVESVMPDYAERRQVLKQEVLPPWH
jgi:hypothetical protein